MLKPVHQTPRYRLVAEQIIASIRNGDLPPGVKMPADRDLVDQLQVSRTTVREAMIALEAMGFVVTRYGSGAYVAQTLPEAPLEVQGLPGYFELVEARYGIEPEIAAIAAQTITAEEIAHLRRCITGMADPGVTLDAAEAFDRDFHTSVARSTGNSVFVSIVEGFWRARQGFPEWTRLNNRRNPDDVIRFYRDEHAAVADALAARDPLAARTAMQVHCRNSGQPLLDHWARLEATTETTSMDGDTGSKVRARIADWQQLTGADRTTRD